MYISSTLVSVLLPSLKSLQGLGGLLGEETPSTGEDKSTKVCRYSYSNTYILVRIYPHIYISMYIHLYFTTTIPSLCEQRAVDVLQIALLVHHPENNHHEIHLFLSSYHDTFVCYYYYYDILCFYTSRHGCDILDP